MMAYKKTKTLFGAIVLLMLLGFSFAYSQQTLTCGTASITYDPTTGFYIIRYQGEAGPTQAILDLPNRVIPAITPMVNFQSGTSLFVYNYTVENDAAAKQAILGVDIGAKEPVTGGVSITPITAHASPQNWFFDEPTDRVPQYHWTGKDDQYLIIPGNSVAGFSLTSNGLPGILPSLFVGLRSPQSLVFTDEPPIEVDNLINLVGARQASRGVSRKTVAPDTLPNNRTPVQLIDRLIGLKEQAFQLGWIDNQGVANSLDTKLNEVKIKLQAGQTKVAGNILKSFILDLIAQHVGQTGQGQGQGNPQGKHVNDNAFYLLKPNAEFILYKLGQL